MFSELNVFAKFVKIEFFKQVIPEPTARSAVRRGLLIPLGYLHPGKCEHSEVESHPPWTLDGFRRYAHARVITDFKNMADYMKSEHWLAEGFRKGENEDKNDCHKTTRDT